MNRLERAFSLVARVMANAGTIALLVMATLVITSAIMRYFVGRPFRFTEELVALLYMAMVYLANPLVTMRRSQITVSVLPERVAHLLGGVLRAGSALVMIGFCTWFAVEAFDFAEYSRRLSSRTEQVDILLWPWMMVVPVTMGFVTLIEVFHLVRKAGPSAAEQSEGLPIGDGL